LEIFPAAGGNMSRDGFSRDAMPRDGMSRDGMSRDGMSRDGMSRDSGGAQRESQREQEQRSRRLQQEREDEDRRRREAERQRVVEQTRREEARKEEDRRRRHEEERRRKRQEEEENARKQAEIRRRQEDEEQARRHAEIRRKREEDEMRRNEQNAALMVRKVIQRVRIATPETYDSLRAELEAVQASQIEALGSQAERVSQEAEKALQQAQQRIDEMNEKRAAEEKARLEEEKRRKAEAELVQRLMKELTEEINNAEDKVTEAEETSKSVTDNAEAAPDVIIEAAETTEKSIASARTVLEAASKSFGEKRNEMGESEAAMKVKRDVGDFQTKLTSGRRTLDKIAASMKAAREKATRKAAALKQEKASKDRFARHDTDADGKLSREEVEAFSVTEYAFEAPEGIVDKIMRVLEPVDFPKFHRLRGMVAVAMLEAKARAKRAEKEERRKALEQRRAGIQKVIDEASALTDDAEKGIDEAELKGRPLIMDADLPADEIKETASETESAAKETETTLDQILAKLTQVEKECEESEELKGFGGREVPRLKQRHSRMQGRLEKVQTAVQSAIEKAVQKAYAELEEQRTKAVTAIRGHMNAEAKKGDQLFADIGGGSALTREKFTEFLGKLSELKLADGQGDRLFDHIVGDASEITEDKFLELIRLYYKCVKQTVLSEELAIKSKTVRRLEMAEVVECLDGPSRDDGANVQRVRCQAVQDGLIGWVTIAGNQGTAFLEPGGNCFSCVKETVLTDGLSVQDSKTVRRVNKGEVIEVLEFTKKDASVGVKRIKGKAKLDGATGWITVCGNQGTVFLEPC